MGNRQKEDTATYKDGLPTKTWKELDMKSEHFPGVAYPKHQSEPDFCPRHSCYAPCLYCLAPQVAEIVHKYHEEQKSFQGFLFLQIDGNEN